ncbi:MAG: GNAT family N-acetyltransferase [Alphaproteobacteria bacterium]
MGDTTTAIDIRPARREDADDIAAMARALSVSDGGRISRFSAEAFLRDGFGDNPAFETMVATVGGVAAGYAVYYWGYDTDSATRGVYLADLYVGERHRRDGVGTALVTGVARRSRDEGGRWIFWSVLKRNKTARRFYRHIAPELKDVLICAAFGVSFDRIAGTGK